MEFNIILTAQTWQLASQLERTKVYGGVLMVKNIPARTYLAVTPKQWLVLSRFNEPHTVPQVLEGIINDRLCPALGEFHELILKAVRARVIVQPGQSVAAVPAVNWLLSVKPSRLRYALWLLFFAGLAATFTLRPALPANWTDGAISFGIMVAAGFLGGALSASLLRGTGGEVYAERYGLIRTTDACMLTPADQRVVALAPMAIMAAAVGYLAWHQPEWSIFPLAGLLWVLRPILGGGFNEMVRMQASSRMSDAEHDYIFPPNRTPRVRWKLLVHGLRSLTTWTEIGYGVIWTLALGYFFGVLTDVPPWELGFWKTQGPRLAMALLISLSLLAAIYLVSEFYLFATERAIARRNALRLWYRRWISRRSPADEGARGRAVSRSPLLRMLPPLTQRELARRMKVQVMRPWRNLSGPEVSLIVSGKVALYRKLPSGRRQFLQVLCEDHIAGLHAVADREHPDFCYRTLSPVVLLQVDWATAEELVISQLGPLALTNQVQKLPFLARIGLCENWHIQAIQRCAELSRIVNYKDGEVILQNGFYSDSFFIMFEGEARVSSRGQVRGLISGGDFFGEIGLLQNSNATAQVTACAGTRCLCIPRREFLRFVAHNHTVALELERVSSARLGHPIFPLTPGNFRSL